MSWTLTGWAQTGADKAVRVQILRDDHDVNEEMDLRAKASGLFRTTYGDWAERVGSSATGPDGKQRTMAPGRQQNPAEDPGQYTVPDEALPTSPPE